MNKTHLNILVSIGIALSLAFIAFMPNSAAQSAEGDALFASANRQSGRAKMVTLREACELKSGEACLEFAQSTDQPNSPTYLQMACEYGDAQLCERADLISRTLYGPATAQTREQRGSRLTLYQLGCERLSASMCDAAARILVEGYSYPTDYEQAAQLLKAACDLGLQRSCNTYFMLSGDDEAGFSLLQRKAELTRTLYETHRAKAASLAPDALSIARNAEKTGNKDKSIRLRIEACEKGYPLACRSAAADLKWEQNAASKFGKSYRELVDAACFELRDEESCYRNAMDGLPKEAYLTFACQELSSAIGCNMLGDFYAALEADDLPAFEANIDRIRAFYQDACLIANNPVRECPPLDRFEQRFAPEAIAEREQRKRETAIRDQLVPYQAQIRCLTDFSVLLGEAIDSGTGDEGFSDFQKACAGSYSSILVTSVCERMETVPDHKALLCRQLTGRLSSDASIGASGWSVSGHTMSRTFRAFSLQAYNQLGGLYQDTLEHDLLLVEFDPNAAVLTHEVGLPAAPLFYPESHQPEARTSVGDAVFRLLEEDGKLIVISPVDGYREAHASHLRAVYELELQPKGADIAADYDSVPVDDTITADTLYFQSAWDSDTGKWNIEAIATFDIQYDQWRKLAISDVYGKLLTPSPHKGTGLFRSETGTWYIPFDTAPLASSFVSRTEIASLYSGEITPEIASAMQNALRLQTPVSWNRRACGYKPKVNFSAAERDFGGLSYTGVQRVHHDLLALADWHACEQAAYHHQAEQARNLVEKYADLPVTDARRWTALLQVQSVNQHARRLETEWQMINKLSTDFDTLSADLKNQQRAEIAERRAEERAARSQSRSAADAFYARIGPGQHLDCLASASSFSAQTACLSDWYATATPQRSASTTETNLSETVTAPVLSRYEFPAADKPVTSEVLKPQEWTAETPREAKSLCPAGERWHACGGCGPPLPPADHGAVCR